MTFPSRLCCFTYVLKSDYEFSCLVVRPCLTTTDNEKYTSPTSIAGDQIIPAAITQKKKSRIRSYVYQPLFSRGDRFSGYAKYTCARLKFGSMNISLEMAIMFQFNTSVHVQLKILLPLVKISRAPYNQGERSSNYANDVLYAMRS